MKDVSQEIIQKIHKEHLEPKPKWRFLAREYVVWILAVAAMLISALSFSVVLYIISEIDWDIYPRLNKSVGEYTILVLPYLWIAFSIIFVGLLYYNLRHTKHGYRFEPLKTAINSLTISAVIGIFLFLAGAGEKAEGFLFPIPGYCNMAKSQNVRLWMQPERGLLAGEIFDKVSNEQFKLRDFNVKVWEIKTISPVPRNITFIKAGVPVKLIGTIEDGNRFIANEIRPLLYRQVVTLENEREIKCGTVRNND